jgi:DNA-binding MarR family transcriptional regulator
MEKPMPRHSSPAHDPQKRERWLAFIQELSPDTNPQTVQLVGLMHRVAHTLHQVGEGSLEAAGLSYAQYRLLMNLLFAEQFEGCGQLNPSEISDRQGIGRNTVSALIRSLEEDGLIERHLDQTDRRKFNISLTAGGRERVRQHARHHFGAVHDCFQTLDAAEQQTMSHLLEKLFASLTSIDKPIRGQGDKEN